MYVPRLAETCLVFCTLSYLYSLDHPAFDGVCLCVCVYYLLCCWPGDVWFTASECEYEAEEEGSLVVISKRTKRKGKRSRDAGSGMAEEEEAGSDQVTGSEKTGIKLQLNFNIQQVSEMVLHVVCLYIEGLTYILYVCSQNEA